MSNLLYLLQKSVNLTGLSNGSLFPLEPDSPELQTALDLFNAVMDGCSNYPYLVTKQYTAADSLQGLGFSNINYVSYQVGGLKLSYLTRLNRKQFDEYSVLPSSVNTPRYYTYDKANQALLIYPNMSGDYLLNVAGMPYVQSDDLMFEFDQYFPAYFQLYIQYEVASLLVQTANVEGMNWSNLKESKRLELKHQVESSKETSYTPNPSSDFANPSAGFLARPSAASFSNCDEILKKLAINNVIADGASLVGYYDSTTGTPTTTRAQLLKLTANQGQITALISSAGITPNLSDNTQTAKAVSNYAHLNNYYEDSGEANAYVAHRPEDQEPFADPTYLKVGMRVRFTPLYPNTGASTFTFGGETHPILNPINGAALTGGEILGAHDVFQPTIELEFVPTQGWFLMSFPRPAGTYATFARLAEKTPTPGASLIGYDADNTVAQKIAALDAAISSVALPKIIKTPLVAATTQYDFAFPTGYTGDDMFSVNVFDANPPITPKTIQHSIIPDGSGYRVVLDPAPTGPGGFVIGMFTKNPEGA
jgi:hypothetical protein